MADQTIRGAYELSTTGARRELRLLRTEAKSTEKAVGGVGRQLDKLAGQAQAIRSVRSEFKSMAREGVKAETEIAAAMRVKTAEVKKQQREVRQLRRDLVSLGRTRAYASVGIRGGARMAAELKALEVQLDRIARKHSTATVRTRQSGASSASFLRNPLSVSRGISAMGAAAVAALPAIQALAGGLFSLGASAASALTGAGALGVAGIGALGVGIAGIAIAAKPAITGIQNVFKAQKALVTAQRTATGTMIQQRDRTWALQSAHEALTDAQNAQIAAQRALTDARREATRAITDQRIAVEQGRISQGRANLEVMRARRAMTEVNLNPVSSSTDRQQARLDLQDALLQQRVARIQGRRNVADTRRTVARGVGGADSVIAARQGAVAARRGVRDARRNVTRAGQTAGGGTTGLQTARNAYKLALRNAPRGSRRLVGHLNSVRTAFGAHGPGRANADLAAAQGNVVSAMDSQVRTLLHLMPTIGSVSRQSTAALARESSALAKWMDSGRIRSFLKVATSMFDENLGGVRRTFQNIAGTLMNITKAARPFLRQAVGYVERMSKGWQDSTDNIGKTQTRIGRMVSHLRDWAKLTRTAFRLLRDVGGGASPSGQGMVRDFTMTLDRWDRWVRKNPEKVQQWFERARDGVNKLGRGLLGIVKILDRLATTLQPLLGAFSTLMGLPGATAIGGSPLALGAGLAAFKFGRRGRGAGAAGEAAVGARGLGRAAGGRAMLGAAAKAIPWLMAFQGGVGALSTQGNLGERIQGGALSAISSIPGLGGLANIPITGSQKRQAGGRRAGNWITANVGANYDPNNTPAMQKRMARIRQEIAHQQSRLNPKTGLFGGTGFLGAMSPADKQTVEGRIAVLNAELRANSRAVRDATAQRERDKREAGRGLGSHYASLFQQRYTNKRGKLGAEGAFGNAISASLNRLDQVGTGAQGGVLARQMTAWANSMAQQNPKLWGQVKRLNDGVRRRWQKMGKDISIVNGQILTGSKSEWGGIASSISDAVAAGVDETGTEFARLRNMAIGSLVAMGWSKSDAKNLFAAQARGGRTATKARGLAQHPNSPLTSKGKRAALSPSSGTGFGDGTGGRGGRGTPMMNLMGANPGLARYAMIGQQAGLGVSSGLRPGAVTSSGNVSLHASGNAIDMSGPAGSMLGYAQTMASQYGSGLDELIYTPLGYGIKNGQRVPLSFWGPTINAQHQDHVHVGDATPGGGGGLGGTGTGAFSLRARASRLGGVPGALASVAGSAYAQALTSRVASAGGAGGMFPDGGDSSSTGGRGRLNRGQLQNLWIRGGGNPAKAPLMATLALRESGGDPTAKHYNTNGTIDRGLWQINSIWGNYSRYGTLANARSAVHVEGAQGPSAWSTYRGTPTGDGTGGGGGRSILVHISMGDVHVRDAREFKHVVERAAEYAANRLSEALDAV